MALVVEDGSGLANAESYISVANATAYIGLTTTLDPTRSDLVAKWNAASTPVKEAALREAAQTLDGKYLERWVGDKGSGEQALAWPRVNAVDAYGFAIASDFVPICVAQSAAELALRAASESVIADIPAGSSNLTAKTVQAGSVSLSQEWGGAGTSGSSSRAKIDRVEAMLRPVLEGGSMGMAVVQLERA